MVQKLVSVVTSSQPLKDTSRQLLRAGTRKPPRTNFNDYLATQGKTGFASSGLEPGKNDFNTFLKVKEASPDHVVLPLTEDDDGPSDDQVRCCKVTCNGCIAWKMANLIYKYWLECTCDASGMCLASSVPVRRLE